MSIKKSQGQKRKTKATIIIICFFLISVFIAASFMRYVSLKSLKWVDTAQTANATLIGLKEETEEYRNLRGRKRYRDHVWLEYEFDVDGQTIQNTVDVKNVINAAKISADLSVLYEQGNPSNHKFKYQVNSALKKKGLLPYVLSSLPFTGGLAYFLSIMLNFLWVRESKKELPDGFYSETRWLDTDDKYVVAIDDGNLISFDIHKNRVIDVQSAFQNGVSTQELIELSKHDDIVTVPLSEITKVTSDHNSDTASIHHNDTEDVLEFLNIKVKTHALQRIIPNLPQLKKYEKRERSRLEAASVSFIVIIILSAIAWYINHYIAYIIIGVFLVMMIIPRFFSRLFDPHTTRSWSKHSGETESPKLN